MIRQTKSYSNLAVMSNNLFLFNLCIFKVSMCTWPSGAPGVVCRECAVHVWWWVFLQCLEWTAHCPRPDQHSGGRHAPARPAHWQTPAETHTPRASTLDTTKPSSTSHQHETILWSINKQTCVYLNSSTFVMQTDAQDTNKFSDIRHITIITQQTYKIQKK